MSFCSTRETHHHHHHFYSIFCEKCAQNKIFFSKKYISQTIFSVKMSNGNSNRTHDTKIFSNTSEYISIKSLSEFFGTNFVHSLQVTFLYLSESNFTQRYGSLMGKIGCLVSKWRRFKACNLCALYLSHLRKDFREILQ